MLQVFEFFLRFKLLTILLLLVDNCRSLLERVEAPGERLRRCILLRLLKGQVCRLPPDHGFIIFLLLLEVARAEAIAGPARLFLSTLHASLRHGFLLLLLSSDFGLVNLLQEVFIVLISIHVNLVFFVVEDHVARVLKVHVLITSKDLFLGEIVIKARRCTLIASLDICFKQIVEVCVVKALILAWHLELCAD